MFLVLSSWKSSPLTILLRAARFHILSTSCFWLIVGRLDSTAKEGKEWAEVLDRSYKLMYVEFKKKGIPIKDEPKAFGQFVHEKFLKACANRSELSKLFAEIWLSGN